MAKKSGFLFGLIVLIGAVGCGGGGSSTPAPTPTPVSPQIFPNDTASAQSAPVKLGTAGGNNTDIGTQFCCIGTLGSLWTKTGVTNPVILSNNHVLDKSDTGTTGDAIIQPLQALCRVGHAVPLTVAHLTQGIVLKPASNNDPAGCAGSTTAVCGDAPKNVDAAIAEIVPGEVDPSGTILDLGAVGAASIAAAPPSATVVLKSQTTLGQSVGKTGRTTGLTCSTISTIGGSFKVVYDSSCGGPAAFTAIFKNQIAVAGGNFSAGGDSGSLIVTTDTARPVALLYGGSTTDSVGNPIEDVITVFGGSGTFQIVGGADHAISCAHTATANGTQVGASQAALIPQEHQRVAAVQKARTPSLMRDFGLASVEIGASADNPSEGALVLHVSGKSVPAIPATIDGVRTRLIFDDAELAAHIPTVGSRQISQAMAAKEAHVAEYMAHPGVQGFGVAVSADNPTEAAIAIHLIKGVPHPTIPAVIDGFRTKVSVGSVFKAY
jgi:hypothetical protein